MNRNSLFWAVLVAVLATLLPNAALAFETVQPTSSFYVNDYANILNQETEQYLIDSNKTLENETGAQIVVVTIPSLDSIAIEDYATTLFRNFGIGDDEKNSGLLLLLALEEREFRIEVGYGLEGALPDGKVGRIEDEYMIPYFKNNEWDTGIKNGFDALLAEVRSEYNLDAQTSSDNEDAWAGVIFYIVITVIFILIINFLSRKTGGISSSGGGSRRTMLTSSSNHSSSSRGGGGSSGGGGASRKF